MAQLGESRYANELVAWPGFEAERKIRELLANNPELVHDLDNRLPGLQGRLAHLLDSLSDLRSVPPHALPTQALESSLGHMQSLVANLETSATNLDYAQHVEASCTSALVTLIPVQGIVGERDVTRVVEEFRSAAQTAIRGVRTSAGKLAARLEETEKDLRDQHNEIKSRLQSELGETNTQLVEEAAQMRLRQETSLTEARTNADAHMVAIRTEVDGIRQRADDAYRETMAAFEAGKQQALLSRDELVASFESQIQTWAEAVTSTRAAIEADVESLKGQLELVVNWADEIRGDIQIAALAAGFDESKKRYAKRSLWALIAASVIAGITIVLTLILFSTLWEVADSASNAEIAKHIGFRIGAISLPFVAALFAARIYRTFSHLEAVNGERAQAAKAFEGFAQRASGDDSRDAMLVILAQLVFSGRDTGHHSDENIFPVNLADLVKQVGIRK